MARTSAQRRAYGLRRLDSVWITEDHLERLNHIAEATDTARAKVIQDMIDKQWVELATRRTKQKPTSR